MTASMVARSPGYVQLTALAVAVALSFLLGRASSPERIPPSQPAASGAPAAPAPAAQDFRDNSDPDASVGCG